MNTVEKVTLDELRSESRGAAYVDDVQVADGRTWLTLVYPTRRVEVAVPAVPDLAAYERPKALEVVLAVQIRCLDEGLRCSVLGSSPDGGPTRRPITDGQALRAAAAGIRTMFETK
jgi:hypothetical protein